MGVCSATGRGMYMRLTILLLTIHGASNVFANSSHRKDILPGVPSHPEAKRSLVNHALFSLLFPLLLLPEQKIRREEEESNQETGVERAPFG